MSSWLSKIRLWEIGLCVCLSFVCYFLVATTQTEEAAAVQVEAVLTHADNTLTALNATAKSLTTTSNQLSTSISDASQAIVASANQLNGVASGLQKTEALINAPCVPGPCGTVADIGKTLNTSRLAIGQVEIAANSFDKNQTNFYKQEDQLYRDSDGAVKNLNNLITSPDITGTLRYVSTTTYNLSQTTTDFQNKFHTFLYPPPCEGWKCKIKTGFEILKTGSELLEPAYYGWALTSGVR